MTGRFEIVGGVYRERCIHPLWDNVFGSAGRAVPCVSAQIPSGVRLHAYIAPSIEPEARQLVAESAVELVPAPADDEIAFDYLHPLAIPRITPSLGSIRRRPPIRVQGEVVLRYGMLEGDAVVDSQIAVYDPQSAFGADPFSANGSRAGRLAVVMNRSEARSMTGLSDPAAAASYLIGSGEAEVVVIKEGARGASVTTRSGSHRVPAYRSARVWKIGSGDVFSASFAALWAGSEADPVEAADLASRATAAYCETRSLPPPAPNALAARETDRVRPGSGMVYLAAPFFDLAQRWLVEEARDTLRSLGAAVFSPVHEIGPGPGSLVAPQDLAGLDASQGVLAILNGMDAGTLFEVGYAVGKGIPVVAFAQNVRPEDLKMIEGTGCDVVDDFATAIYRTVWQLPS